MKASEKKTLLKHIKKDSKEFRSQLKEDQQLKKQILSKGSSKEKKHEAKESKAHERKEKKSKK